MKKIFLFLIEIIQICLLLCCACGGQKEPAEKKQLDFTICKEEELPDELKECIEEKKQRPFQLTFENSASLYIVSGYGEQPRGEYVAAINELYETEKGIYVDTTLISISYVKDSKAGEPSSYPYVVLKCKKTKKPVFFL